MNKLQVVVDHIDQPIVQHSNGKRWVLQVKFGSAGTLVWFVKKPTRRQITDVIRWVEQAKWGETYTRGWRKVRPSSKCKTCVDGLCTSKCIN